MFERLVASLLARLRSAYVPQLAVPPGAHDPAEALLVLSIEVDPEAPLDDLVADFNFMHLAAHEEVPSSPLTADGHVLF